MGEQRANLEKSMSTFDVLAMAFGTMIGWGWIMLSGVWVEQGGVLGGIIAFAIGVVMCIFVGIAYSELSPAIPTTGGAFVFSYRAMGYNGSWIAGWANVFAYVGVAAWEGPALATAINYLIPIPPIVKLWTVQGFDVTLSFVLIAVVSGLILTWINYSGGKNAATFESVATIALAIGGILFFISSMIKGSPVNAQPLFTNGRGIVAVIIQVPAMFVGFDVIPQTIEEMNFPITKVAKIVIVSIIMAGVWYMIMILATAFAAPQAVREGANIPVADAFAYCMNSAVLGKCIIIVAICGILTSWNGFIIGSTRLMFSMGRAKMLPEVFGKTHPKYNTPYASTILIGIVTCLSPLLGKNALVWFVDASSLGTVVAYLMVVLSFVILRKKEPELNRPYQAPAAGVIGVIALICVIFFMYLYMPFGPGALKPIEWGLVFAWIVLGIVLYLIANSRYKNVKASEREMLIFGEELARKDYLDGKYDK